MYVKIRVKIKHKNSNPGIYFAMVRHRQASIYTLLLQFIVCVKSFQNGNSVRDGIEIFSIHAIFS